LKTKSFFARPRCVPTLVPTSILAPDDPLRSMTN
jgi:hypothetical protein